MKSSKVTKIFVDKIILGITIGTTSWLLGIFTNQLQTKPVIEELKTSNIQLEADVENLEWGLDYYTDPDFY